MVEEGKRKDSNNERAQKDGRITVILKIGLNCHCSCHGCTVKIISRIKNIEGVESVKIDNGNVLVTGNVDPVNVREAAEKKTRKKVLLISPLPKKEDVNKKNEKKFEDSKGKNPDNKKSLEVTVAVLKLYLDCDACIEKAQKIVTQTEGYQEMHIDRKNNLMKVKGTMDMKGLADSMTKKLGKSVQIIESNVEKKVKADRGGGSNEKQEKDLKKGEDGGSAKGKDTKERTQYGPLNLYGHGICYEGLSHLLDHLNDENPNACFVM